MPIVEDRNRAIGKKIRQLREQKELSQVKLAHKARISPSTVQSIELGERDVRHSTLEKIAEVLRVKVKELTKAPDRNAIDGNGVNFAADDDKLSSYGDSWRPRTTDQRNHLLIDKSEILEWVAQTMRIAMMTNRREAICTLISTVLAGFGLPGCGHAGAENDAVRSIAYGLDGQRVGGEAAKWARDQVAVLNQLAIRFSGQELYSIAEVNLHLLRTLLQARAATGQDDSELRLAIAHTASLTGWFAEDAELFEQASQHYHFAVEMAHSAGGHDFAVFSLARLAATDLAKGQPAQCLAQLEATAAEAGQDSPWRSFIQMFAVEAYGKLGDISKAQRMLAKADVLYDGRDTGRLPEWAYWIPRPSSTSIAARSFIPHDPRFAAMLYEHALEQVPAEFVCDRIHLKVGLARAKQNLGDLDEALFRAGEVLQEVLSLREPRAEKMLIEFHANLPDDPVAKEFKERFTDYARMRKLGTLHS